MFAAAKGNGKAKGGKSEGKVQGHTLARTRISAEKFQGTVEAWKGKYGWIKPGEEVPHEKASLHKGNLFCSMNDLIDVESLEAGATVEFHICEDSSGLGAEEVVVLSSPTGGAATGGKAKGKSGKGKSIQSTTPAATGGFWSAAQKGNKGENSWSKGWGKTQTTFGKGKESKGEGKGKRTPGHLLPRTRITAEKFAGTVLEWKGKYGWITPAETVEHEKAEKHQGRIFVSMNDLEGGLTELTSGATVEFHIWEDASGLGAEEVVQS